jgi:hypothetical protein
VSWWQTRRTSVFALRDERERKKSNFPSYLKKKEEVCRLKSVSKKYTKRGAGIKEGAFAGRGGWERGTEEEKMSEPTF